MLSKTKKTEPAVQAEGEAAAKAPTKALLFELEFMAVDGYSILYGILKDKMAELGAKLPEALFSRFTLCSSPEFYMAELMQAAKAEKGSADRLAAAVKEEFESALLEGRVALQPQVAKLCEAAAEAQISVAVLSMLPEEKATTLVEKLGLTRWAVRPFSFQVTDESFPHADMWLKIARGLAVSPRRCLVVSPSMESLKSALAADLRCVAVPNRFTDFHDFGGAEQILESPDEMGSAKDFLQACFAEPATV